MIYKICHLPTFYSCQKIKTITENLKSLNYFRAFYNLRSRHSNLSGKNRTIDEFLKSQKAMLGQLKKELEVAVIPSGQSRAISMS
jgi:hypothetical protein